jgi:hypothetical protein
MLPKPVDGVIFRALEEGGVLLHARDEVYFGLNEVGARVWALLPPRSSGLDELVSVIASEYPEVPADTIRADVQELLDDLVEHGLLAVEPAAS